MIRSLATRRTLAAAALAPLLLTGVAACGDDSGSEGKDSSAGSAVLASLQEGDQVDPDEFVKTVADGIEQSTTAHVELDVSVGDKMSTNAEGDLDYTSKPPSMQMTMDLPMGKTEMVMVDGVLYMKMGALSQGRYWKLDLSDADGPLGKMGLDKMLDQSDPLGALETMKPGIEKVTFEGNEDVDGRDLDHYTLTVDPQAALDASGAELPSGADAKLPDSVTYDLWLDEQDRFARMKMDYPVMGEQLSMTMNVDDWGKDVSIEAPPTDEVQDMPDLGSMVSPAPNA